MDDLRDVTLSPVETASSVLADLGQPTAPGFVVVSSVPPKAEEESKAGDGTPVAVEAAPKKRNSPYTPWTLEEDSALMDCLIGQGLAGQKLGERTMQELDLTTLPQLGQRSFKAIYNRYNKHLQWRSKRSPNSLKWLHEMHEAAANGQVTKSSKNGSSSKSGSKRASRSKAANAAATALAAAAMVAAAAAAGEEKETSGESTVGVVVSSEPSSMEAVLSEMPLEQESPLKRARPEMDSCAHEQAATVAMRRWGEVSGEWERAAPASHYAEWMVN